MNLNVEDINELQQQPQKNEDSSISEKQKSLSPFQKLKEKRSKQSRPRIAIPSFYNFQRKSESSLMSSSTTTLTAPSPSPNNKQFDISQYIPKRTSSNEANVSEMLRAFQPTHASHNGTSPIHYRPKSPQITPTNPEVITKLLGKRLQLQDVLKVMTQQDKRIQVTLDADVFSTLWIRHSSNSMDIKRAVLYKLGIDAEPHYFLFYHETGGHQTNTPLNDDDLVYICQASDDNRTNRVLVVPIEGYKLNRQQTYQNSLNNFAVRYILSENDSSPIPSPISCSPITGIQLTDPETPVAEKVTATDAVTPIKTSLSSQDLWAIQPNQKKSPDEPTAIPAVSFWAVKPKTVVGSIQQQQSLSSPTVNITETQLWPVEDQKAVTAVAAESIATEDVGVSLFDPPTPKHEKTTAFSSSSPIESLPSPICSQKSSSNELEDEKQHLFGERPSFEKLYRDIDKYLPNHDLDKEIVLEQTPSLSPSLPPPQQQQPTALPTRRLLGHRPSVRIVAKEAHNRWKQATRNIVAINNLNNNLNNNNNALLRRKSTKMWGQPIERVKPGEEGRIVVNKANIVISATQAAATVTNKTSSTTPPPPDVTKIQWMRGNLIGRGSFGKVYHALNIATGEWFAVKQVDIAVTQSDQRNQQLKDAADNLYREISLLKDLDHENIVQYLGYDSNLEEGLIYIFLEYVPGGSISSLLSQYEYFDEAMAKFFTKQILQGLAYLHERFILHRDIKGDNVLIDLNGMCKIADFGLSKNQQEEAYDTQANHSLMRGTVFWMAPEALTNNYSAKVDVWSLGCTVLEMITGKHPWMELTRWAALYQIGKHNAPAIPENISDEAKDFLQLCFQIEPENRPTAVELLEHAFLEQDASFDFKQSLLQQQPKTTT